MYNFWSKNENFTCVSWYPTLMCPASKLHMVSRQLISGNLSWETRAPSVLPFVRPAKQALHLYSRARHQFQHYIALPLHRWGTASCSRMQFAPGCNQCDAAWVACKFYDWQSERGLLGWNEDHICSSTRTKDHLISLDCSPCGKFRLYWPPTGFIYPS